MSFPNFPSGITPSIEGDNGTDTSVRVLRASFGDGYDQIAADGINSIRDQRKVSFANITTAKRDIIQTFLRGAKGTTPFHFNGKLWTCEQWSETPIKGGLYWTINCTFIQNFSPEPT